VRSSLGAVFSWVSCQTTAAISSATRSRKATSSRGMVDGTAPTDAGCSTAPDRRVGECALAGWFEFIDGVVIVLALSEDEASGCAED
jgi:hypothetical protein